MHLLATSRISYLVTTLLQQHASTSTTVIALYYINVTTGEYYY